MSTSSEKKGPENRSSLRINLALEIGYRSAGAFLISYSVNLSRGGLFIESNTPLPTGTPVDLKINTPDAETIAIRGTVAWVRYTADGGEGGEPPGMGIAIATMEDRYGLLIDRIANNFLGIHILLAVGQGQPRIRQMLHRHLAATVSCQVEDAEDAFEEINDRADCDLAIVNLDWLHGEQLLVTLRQKQPQMPILVFARNPSTRQHAIEIGATATLESPPTYPELRAAVIAALARPSSIGNAG